jgi:dolichol-phosphate mannosyltransferase
MGGRHELALVMPVYNEEGCINDVVKSWHDEFARLDIDFIMIILDDGSNDGTRQKLSTFASNSRIFIIEKENSGHGPTILRGYHKAVGLADWIFQVDSDDEIRPCYFSDIWIRRNDYDGLFGIRINRRQTLERKFISFISRMIINFLFSPGVNDVNVPYRLIRSQILRQVITQMPINTFAPNVIISGAVTALQAKICNLAVIAETRKTGTVSIARWKLWKTALKSFCQTIKLSRKFKAQGHSFVL